MKKQNIKNLPLVTDLPSEYSLEIGKIAVHWAHVEWRLRQIMYLILDVTPPVGRIALREAKEPEYLNMIVELMDLGGMTISGEVKELRADLDNWGRWRNRLAHGVWVKHPDTGELMVQATTGQWDKGKLAPGEKLSRKILTEAITVTADFLKEIDGEIVSLGASLEDFWNGLSAYFQSLHGKSQRRSQWQDRRMDHIARKLQPRRRSSQGWNRGDKK